MKSSANWLISNTKRNDIDFHRGTFRVKGACGSFPRLDDNALRIEFYGDEIERISEFNALTGEVRMMRNHITIFPASHYVTTPENMEIALHTIEEELEERLKELRSENKLVEAQRLMQRTHYDLEILREMGYCKGIENYTRHINRTNPASAVHTVRLLPEDFLVYRRIPVTIPHARHVRRRSFPQKKMIDTYSVCLRHMVNVVEF
jgi:excinuclease ABC subunit B